MFSPIGTFHDQDWECLLVYSTRCISLYHLWSRWNIYHYTLQHLSPNDTIPDQDWECLSHVIIQVISHSLHIFLSRLGIFISICGYTFLDQDWEYLSVHVLQGIYHHLYLLDQGGEYLSVHVLQGFYYHLYLLDQGGEYLSVHVLQGFYHHLYLSWSRLGIFISTWTTRYLSHCLYLLDQAWECFNSKRYKVVPPLRQICLSYNL